MAATTPTSTKIPAPPGTLRHALATLRTFARIEIASNMRYRLNLFIWMLTWAFSLIVALAVWQAVADGRPSGSAGGFTAATFAGYYLVLLVTRLITSSWSSWLISEGIAQGELSVTLARPVNPLLVFYARTTGSRTIQLGMAVPLAAGMWVLFSAKVEGSPAEIAAGIGLLIPAAALGFFIDIATIGLLAFWVTRIFGLLGLFSFITALFGGFVAPIPLLPEGVRMVAYALPFYWSAGYPAQLITGQASLSLAPVALGVTLTWLVLLWAFVHVMWPRALRRYEAVGG